MENISLKNKEILVNIQKMGAEVQSIDLLPQNSHILWQKDELFWNRVAPILFPIVGKLKDDQYSFDGNMYSMKQHGFARDSEFELLYHSDESATFRLQSTEKTRLNYPFQFELEIHYTLHGKSLYIEWIVSNPSKTMLPFSIGGHPGFHLHKSLENYKLVFDKPITAERHLIENGYYSGITEPMMKESDTLFLNSELFLSDAIVFKHVDFQSVSLKTIDNELVATCSSSDFPYWGFWTKPGAPFFCIEPWAGLADLGNSQGNFLNKEGLIILEGHSQKSFKWTISV